MVRSLDFYPYVYTRSDHGGMNVSPVLLHGKQFRAGNARVKEFEFLHEFCVVALIILK